MVNAVSFHCLLWVGYFSSLTLYFEVIISIKITPRTPFRDTVSSIHACHYLSFTISLAWFQAETNWTGNKTVKVIGSRIFPVVINDYRKFVICSRVGL